MRRAVNAVVTFTAVAAFAAAARAVEPAPFRHATHAGRTCETCHPKAARSTTAGDALAPGAESCAACHAPGTVALRPSAPAYLPAARGLKFSHLLHAGRGVSCATCHVDGALPAMRLCVNCHEGRTTPPMRAPAKCATCHATLPDGRLRTDFSASGGGMLTPEGSWRATLAHGPGFARNHMAAARDEATCMACHKRQECQSCHGAGTIRPVDLHPGNYLTLHVADARRGGADCATCHRTQTFCVGCHQRSGVAADPEGGQRGKRPANPFGTGTGLKSFHPPGWAREASGALIVGRPPEHARQARLNIRSCASCHREESCIECHSTDPTASFAASPHGPKGTFARSAKCKAMAARNQRVCLKCHGADDDALGCR